MSVSPILVLQDNKTFHSQTFFALGHFASFNLYNLLLLIFLDLVQKLKHVKFDLVRLIVLP